MVHEQLWINHLQFITLGWNTNLTLSISLHFSEFTEDYLHGKNIHNLWIRHLHSIMIHENQNECGQSSSRQWNKRNNAISFENEKEPLNFGKLI